MGIFAFSRGRASDSSASWLGMGSEPVGGPAALTLESQSPGAGRGTELELTHSRPQNRWLLCSS